MHLHVNPPLAFLKVSRENETTQSVLVLLFVLLKFMADLIIFVTQKAVLKLTALSKVDKIQSMGVLICISFFFPPIKWHGSSSPPFLHLTLVLSL